MTDNLRLSNNLSLRSVQELLSQGSTYTTAIQSCQYTDEMKLCYNSNAASTVKVDVLGSHDASTFETKKTLYIQPNSFIHSKVQTDSNFTKLKFTNLDNVSNVGVQGYSYLNRNTTLPKVTGSHSYNSEEDSHVLVKDVGNLRSDDILQGNSSEIARLNFLTSCESITIENKPVWNEGASSYFYKPTSQVAVSIVSDNAGDTSAGIGLQTALLSGVDSNDDTYSETISMNGVTPVTSSHQYKYVNNLESVTVGTGDYNQGNISVYDGASSNLMAYMHQTNNVNDFSHYYVANKKGLTVKNLSLNAHCVDPTIMEIRKVDATGEKLEKKLLINSETSNYLCPINIHYATGELFKLTQRTKSGNAATSTDNMINVQLETYVHTKSE